MSAEAALSAPAPAQSDFEQVCWRLAGFEPQVSPEWVDGYLCAVLAGPRAVPADEWLPAMLGDAFGRVFADPADDRYARRALGSRWRELAAQLDAEALLYEPDVVRLSPWLLAFEDADLHDYVAQGRGTIEQARHALQPGTAWALGFRRAVADFAADWSIPDADAPQGRDFAAALEDIDALHWPEDELKAYIARRHEGRAVDRDDLVDAACLAAQDLRLYWVDHAPRPETRRVEPQPGRNDPCPCGSGRKFKKCHGA